MANVTEGPTPLAGSVTGAGGPVPSGQPTKKRWILIVGVIAVLTSGSAVGWWLFRGKLDAAPATNHAKTPAAPASTEASQIGSAPSTVGPLYDLDPFIVNLADTPEVRYLKLTIKLELARPEASAEVAARVPQIRDAVLILLSGKDSTSLRSTQGKFQLRDELTQRIAAMLPNGGIKTVYFTEFVIQ
ncbi:flagellar basal body-associated FliL family protein [Nitrospira sp. Kam-Ns4a]